MGTQFKAFRLSERLSPTRRARLLTTVKVAVSPAANGVPAEGSFNSLSLIDRTAERNRFTLASIEYFNAKCALLIYRLLTKTYHR